MSRFVSATFPLEKSDTRDGQIWGAVTKPQHQRSIFAILNQTYGAAA
jgi:hypothetical protein